jgi:Uma2 family endonuclease
MSASREPHRLTVEDYARLPDDDVWRDELSRGRLVREPRPGAEHALVNGNVHLLLRLFVDAHQLGRVVVEGGFRLPRVPATVRGPDVAFIRAARLPSAVPIGFYEMAPDLAVEVVSTSNTRRELREKLTDYFDAGVQEVWVVRPGSRTVDVHRAGGLVSTLRDDDAITSPLLPGLVLPLGDIFRC